MTSKQHIAEMVPHIRGCCVSRDTPFIREFKTLGEGGHRTQKLMLRPEKPHIARDVDNSISEVVLQ